MCDVTGCKVIYLVNVPVEHGDLGVRIQNVDRRLTVARRPVPLGRKIKKGTMGKYDHRRVGVLLGQILFEPCELIIAERGARIGDIVEHDEMNALVIERVIRVTKELTIGGTTIQRGIMLTRHEVHGLDIEVADDFPEFAQAPTPFRGIIGGMGQVAREHDEVRWCLQRVDGVDSLRQGRGALGVGRAGVTPMAVGELHKIEVSVRHGGPRTPRQTR